jgi:chloramphenicol 3-O-phosphotransferase
MNEITREHMQLSASDPAELTALHGFLRAVAPAARVVRLGGRPQSGQLGVADALQVAADSAVLAAVVQSLPEFLRSRRKTATRPRPAVRVTIRKDSFEVTGSDAAEVAEILNRLLDE